MDSESQPLELKPVPAEIMRDAPICTAEGLRPSDFDPDEDEVFRKAIQVGRKAKQLQKRRERQYLRFSHGPVGLCFFGDLHFGGHGVDYEKAFRDAEIVSRTPGLFAILCGADLDNFILEKLMHYNMDQGLSINESWALFRRWLRIMAPKLRVIVSGNHDAWNWLLTSVDYMKEVVGQISPNCIYDRDDCKITVEIRDKQWPGRVRHRWRGRSIYNPTHAMERLMKWDGAGFVWAAGAHDHDGGCCRGSNLGGIPRMAAKTWTYKFNDSYARAGGFPLGGPHESPTIIFDDTTGEMMGVASLELASWVMANFYRNPRVLR